MIARNDRATATSEHARCASLRAARRVMSTPSPPSYVKSYAEQAAQQDSSRDSRSAPGEGTVRRARDIAAHAVFL